MKSLKVLLPALAVLALSGGLASAQTLTANGESIDTTDINPTLGFSLYYTAGVPEVDDLPSFVTGETFYYFASDDSGPPKGYYQGEYKLTVDGTQYSTGDTDSGNNNDNNTLLDTLTLGSGTPSSFNLGVLTNNQGSETTQITVKLDNPLGGVLSSVTEGTSSSSQGSTDNDIYYSLVTGATAGDTLNFYVTSSRYAVIGGLTFDAVVPEPTTWALFLGGLGLLGFMTYRRRQQV